MQNKYFILVLFVIGLLAVSCNSTDPADVYAQWKSDNEKYLISMKDSAGYIRDTVPTNIGNLYYYYKIITPAISGGSPAYTDNAKVNYKGSLITGKVFDSTFKGNAPDSTSTPRTFYLNKIIIGWTDNLMRMKVGERRIVILPQELCYGSYGVGSIPPYSTLRFDIQLISYSGQ